MRRGTRRGAGARARDAALAVTVGFLAALAVGAGGLALVYLALLAAGHP